MGDGQGRRALVLEETVDGGGNADGQADDLVGLGAGEEKGGGGGGEGGSK